MKLGIVYLVGAGPGDPELMTLRAMRLLQTADTIIHDRLIPHEVLTWSRPEATLIDVGKYPDHHRISQSEINELLVERALRGETVIRLKGGDPFVFGRGQEERAACREAGIRCEIVPGISSCIAAASAVGIPVTTRGVARSFAVVTGQTDPNLDNDIDFAALAGIDTVVVLMGRKNLAVLATSLIESGRDPETPVASIENATLPNQRVVTGSLLSISEVVQEAGLRSPMVTVIGSVVELMDGNPLNLPESAAVAMRDYVSGDIHRA
jgi:uroporphyrin-III C-methyltransferase